MGRKGEAVNPAAYKADEQQVPATTPMNCLLHSYRETGPPSHEVKMHMVKWLLACFLINVILVLSCVCLFSSHKRKVLH